MKLGPTLLFLILCAPLAAQNTQRVSVDSSGIQANAASGYASISADGRFVAFPSSATNLVPGDLNHEWDIFVRDRLLGITERVSVDSLGVESNDYCTDAMISANGRFVVFESEANNLVVGDTNLRTDIFVHDRQTGITERVSVDSLGVQGNDYSDTASISADGRYVVFESESTNLVIGDTNGVEDIFLHDRQTGITERISVDSSGVQADDMCYGSMVSRDGRYVAFDSDATNLVAGDSNGARDVFLRDRLTGLTSLISVDSFGVQGSNMSRNPSISADGTQVCFESTATNLVLNDNNSNLDVFVHNLSSGLTTRVSVKTGGAECNGSSHQSSLSADGRIVAFTSWATDLVPGDTNGWGDVFVHDRQTGVTNRISVSPGGVQGNKQTFSYYSSCSADGKYISFAGYANNLVPNDTNNVGDAFVRNRSYGSDINTVVLVGPYTAPVGNAVDFEWFAAPPSSKYYMHYSLNINGTVFAGHQFDIGSPATLLGSGLHSPDGTATYTTSPVPSAAAGYTVYFEVAVRSGGQFFDSTVQPILFY